jgi:hypothetical protein
LAKASINVVAPLPTAPLSKEQQGVGVGVAQGAQYVAQHVGPANKAGLAADGVSGDVGV